LFDFEVIANFFIMFLTHVPLLYIQLLILWKEGEAVVLNNLGTLCYSNGDFDRSLSYYQQALKIYKEVRCKNKQKYQFQLFFQSISLPLSC
jgi:tetratricopeptide (TPR) repeat protein